MKVLYVFNEITRSGDFTLRRQREVDGTTRNENTLTGKLTVAARLVNWSPEDYIEIKGQFSGRYRVEAMEHSKDGVFILSSLVREERSEGLL